MGSARNDRSEQREVVVIPTGGLQDAGKGLVQDTQNAEGAVMDPALKMSELYVARGVGRQPGTLTQSERESTVRASIPGGDKELPSEIRRTSSEPESARHLPPSESAAITLQWANLSPETKRLRMMQQQT